MKILCSVMACALVLAGISSCVLAQDLPPLTDAIPNANSVLVQVLGAGRISLKNDKMTVEEFGYLAARLGSFHPERRIVLSIRSSATLPDVQAALKLCADGRLTNVALSYENGREFLVDPTEGQALTGEEIPVLLLGGNKVFPPNNREMPLGQFLADVKESLKTKPDLRILLSPIRDVPEEEFKTAYLQCKAAGVCRVLVAPYPFTIIR